MWKTLWITALNSITVVIFAKNEELEKALLKNTFFAFSEWYSLAKFDGI